MAPPGSGTPRWGGGCHPVPRTWGRRRRVSPGGLQRGSRCWGGAGGDKEGWGEGGSVGWWHPAPRGPLWKSGPRSGAGGWGLSLSPPPRPCTPKRVFPPRWGRLLLPDLAMGFIPGPRTGVRASSGRVTSLGRGGTGGATEGLRGPGVHGRVLRAVAPLRPAPGRPRGAAGGAQAGCHRVSPHGGTKQGLPGAKWRTGAGGRWAQPGDGSAPSHCLAAGKGWTLVGSVLGARPGLRRGGTHTHFSWKVFLERGGVGAIRAGKSRGGRAGPGHRATVQCVPAGPGAAPLHRRREVTSA